MLGHPKGAEVGRRLCTFGPIQALEMAVSKAEHDCARQAPAVARVNHREEGAAADSAARFLLVSGACASPSLAYKNSAHHTMTKGETPIQPLPPRVLSLSGHTALIRNWTVPPNRSTPPADCAASRSISAAIASAVFCAGDRCGMW